LEQKLLFFHKMRRQIPNSISCYMEWSC